MKHKKNCTCEICNSNPGKEERQFAAMKFRKGNEFILWDAEEVSAFYKYLDNKSSVFPVDTPNYPVKEIISSEYILAYGVIIPNPIAKVPDCHKEAEEFKNFGLATFMEDTIHMSVYKDIWISDEKIYKDRLPCAVLLQTSVNIEKKRDFGFGYTMFVRYQTEDGYMNIFENIINRPFAICVRDVVKKFDDYPDNWKSYIDIQSCIKTAKELI